MTTDFKIDASGWSRHARAYNLPSGQSLSFPMVQAAFEGHFFQSLEQQVAKLPADQKLKVLTLCGGTGPETLLICEHLGARVEVLSTDNAQGMVDVCNEAIRAAGFGGHAKSVLMDAMNIDAPDNSYDAVFLILGPMLLPDADACLRQVARILKPSARFYTLTPGKMDIHDVMTACKRDVLAASGKHAMFQDAYANTILRMWGTPDILEDRLRRLSLFEDVKAFSVASALAAGSREEIDGVLDTLFHNPGMEKMYTGDLTAAERETFRRSVRNAFHNQMRHSAHFAFAMQANCAYATM